MYVIYENFNYWFDEWYFTKNVEKYSLTRVASVLDYKKYYSLFSGNVRSRMREILITISSIVHANMHFRKIK